MISERLVVGRRLPERRAARKRDGATAPCARQMVSLLLPAAMLEDAVNALTEVLAPPLRAVLWKSIGLALVLIIAVGVALERLIVWLLGSGSASVETTLGPHAHVPTSIFAWLLSIAAGLGIIVGSVLLMPAVTAFVASFFADEIAAVVERADYPADPPGSALPLSLAMLEGGKTALLAIAVYLCAAPLLLFAGFGAVIFFLATAWLLGREYFELAAMRFRPPQEAKALRRYNAATVYVGGLLIAAFVSIPIVNLATPLFAMALMVHVHKRLGGGKFIARNL
jgi:CysZ protein